MRKQLINKGDILQTLEFIHSTTIKIDINSFFRIPYINQGEHYINS